MKDKENQIFDKYGNYDFPTEMKQEGLNTATTQIEEMANCKKCIHNEMCIDKISCGVLTASKDGHLKLKCKYYQPKLPKDSVVLSREEYKTLLNQNKGLTEENGQLRLENNDLETQYEKIYEQAEQNVLANIADGGTSCHWCIEQHEKKARKETAEKILQFIYDRVIDKHFIKKAEEFAQQFGVEIKD